MTSQVGKEVAVRPFRVDVPEEDLVDLRRHIVATRWPDRETVPDRSQSAQLAELQESARCVRDRGPRGVQIAALGGEGA
jgi:hypothetical protein